MRRALIILAIIIVLAGAGIVGYFYFFANKASVTVETPTTNSTLPVAGDTGATAGATTENTATPAEITVPTQAAQKISPRLIEIDKGPVVSGAIAYDIPVPKGATSTPEIGINYLERESGNIFSYFVRAGTLTRTSNRTIPGIQEAFWLPSGTTAFVRYLSDQNHATINTYALPQNGNGGYFLAQDITTLAVSSTNLLALASGINGSVGTLEKIDGSQAKKVFTTPLTSLRAAMISSGRYIAFTKPSALIDGYVYLINVSGNFEKIAGPTKGLVALPSPSGKWALLSSSSGSNLKMNLLNVTTGELISLPVATIADKCVWASSETAVYCAVPVSTPANYAYPDDWYQGAVTLNDRVWKIDVANRLAELILDFSKETNTSLDATSLSVDPIEQVLVFRNKIDASLWSYQL